MSIINNCIRKIKNVNSKHIDTLWLLMSKSYLKILSLLYFVNNTYLPITPDIVKEVLKKTYIFNNVVLISKPCIIKASNNSNLAIRHFITTIYSTNINLSIPQYKNYWKWDHLTFRYQLYMFWYIKCMRPHKSEHHKELVWCYQKNTRVNPLRFTTKKDKPYQL